jgi:hypothetical protein
MMGTVRCIFPISFSGGPLGKRGISSCVRWGYFIGKHYTRRYRRLFCRRTITLRKPIRCPESNGSSSAYDRRLFQTCSPRFAQALSAGITLGNHFQFGIGMPQRFPIAAGTSARTLRHCSDATCRALTRQHGNGALVTTDSVAFMQTIALTAAMDTGPATRGAAGTSPYLARGLHVWFFVSTRTEYSFNR